MQSIILTSKDLTRRHEYVEQFCLKHAISEFDYQIFSTEEPSIGIADIRNLQSSLYHTPVKGEERLLVIEDAQKITLEAQNALLKLLEEPPLYLTVMLSAADIKSFLPTVMSRCRVVELSNRIPAFQVGILENIAIIMNGTLGEKLVLAEKLAAKKEELPQWFESIILSLHQQLLGQPEESREVAGNDEVDLRISVLPTVHGEKIVMRLLRKSGGIPTLPDLGLTGTSLKALETAILRPHGIILVCGPTGSGKTTTLYAVLAKLNTSRVNIVSLEDPVEYEIPGVNQVQINPAVGLTFADGLRSFLRQDPNIILVGEIRDGETEDLAVQAALTGHLVFSTLHTSDAAGALPRLLDLGAETFLLASTITAVMGQRIVRKICDHCKQPYTPAPQLVEEMKTILGPLFPQGQVQLYRGKGCSECGDSGYMGRIGIFEVLTVTEKIAHLVLQRADSEVLQKQAVADGMIAMKQDGYLKALAGLTTIEEVLRVAQE